MFHKCTWPNLLDVVTVVSFGGAIISGCMCISSLLNLRQNHRPSLLVLAALSGNAILFMMAYLFVPFHHVIFLLHILAVPTAIAILAVLVHSTPKKLHMVPTLASWTLMILSILASTLARLAWIPDSHYGILPLAQCFF